MVTPPSVAEHLKVEVFAKEKVLLLRLNRPHVMNAVDQALTEDLEKVLTWFEAEPSLWVAIVTGTGRAFSAGADLKAVKKNAVDKPRSNDSGSNQIVDQPAGFAAISTRRMKKPIIAAVNGIAMGGGAEIAIGCDIIIGHPNARFSYPEVRRGLVAAMGGIPNVALKAPRLIPYLLTGEPIPPKLVEEHIFTETVELDQVLPTAFKWAERINQCSPDAVEITKEAINMALLDGKGVWDVVVESAKDPDTAVIFQGANFKEGITAFNEKRAPAWKNPEVRPKAKL